SFNYGTITLYGQASTPIRLPASSTALHGSTTHAHPTTPTTQPLPGITRDRFSLIRVRSPLLTESPLFSLPAGTEMFHFPTFPPTGLYIQPAVTHKTKAMHAGFPHSDILPHRLVINSTRLIADSHVLHRLLLPRHPPCALTNLPNQQPHKTGPSAAYATN